MIIIFSTPRTHTDGPGIFLGRPQGVRDCPDEVGLPSCPKRQERCQEEGKEKAPNNSRGGQRRFSGKKLAWDTFILFISDSFLY